MITVTITWAQWILVFIDPTKVDLKILILIELVCSL